MGRQLQVGMLGQSIPVQSVAQYQTFYTGPTNSSATLSDQWAPKTDKKKLFQFKTQRLCYILDGQTQTLEMFQQTPSSLLSRWITI